MKLREKLEAVAGHFAKHVTIPDQVGCCGMAGDQGFIFSELTHSATKLEAEEVRMKKYDGYYSSTRTCEMAMSDAVKENYRSFLHFVDEAMV